MKPSLLSRPVASRLALGAALIPILVLSGPAAESAAETPIAIGSRLEPFVDDFLIHRLSGARLELHTPQPAGVALRFDQPWEGSESNFVTVFRDADRIRMYYRSGPGGVYRGVMKPGEASVPDHPAVIAY